LLFAPWTTLMYVIIFPMNGFDWLWIGFGIMADMAAYLGGYHNRSSVPVVNKMPYINEPPTTPL